MAKKAKTQELGTLTRTIGAAQYSVLSPVERQKHVDAGVEIAYLPHAWEARERQTKDMERHLNSQRDELIAVRHKAEELEYRLKNEDRANTDLRRQLVTAQDEARRLNAALHATIDVLGGTKPAGFKSAPTTIAEFLRDRK